MGLLTNILLRTAIGYIFYNYQDGNIERYKVVALCVVAILFFHVIVEREEIEKFLSSKKK